jgi:hypothetical protein
VAELLGKLPTPNRIALIVDCTGVGRPVCDLFKKAKLPAQTVPVTITAGHQVTNIGNEYRTPKRTLASVVQAILQSRRLRIAGNLPEAQTLFRELTNFKVKVTLAGNETFESWRESEHDDLVRALALAAWYGEQGGAAFRMWFGPEDCK